MDTPGIAFLDAIKQWTGVDTFTKVPMKRPDMFIRVDFGAGKTLTPASERRLVAVQIYGKNPTQVTELAYKLRLFLMDSVYTHSDKVLWWDEQAGPHEWPDPDLTTTHRWQITGDLYLTLT